MRGWTSWSVGHQQKVRCTPAPRIVRTPAVAIGRGVLWDSWGRFQGFVRLCFGAWSWDEPLWCGLRLGLGLGDLLLFLFLLPYACGFVQQLSHTLQLRSVGKSCAHVVHVLSPSLALSHTLQVVLALVVVVRLAPPFPLQHCPPPRPKSPMLTQLCGPTSELVLTREWEGTLVFLCTHTRARDALAFTLAVHALDHTPLHFRYMQRVSTSGASGSGGGGTAPLALEYTWLVTNGPKLLATLRAATSS